MRNHTLTILTHFPVRRYASELLSRDTEKGSPALHWKSPDNEEITCLNLSFTDIDTSTQSVAEAKNIKTEIIFINARGERRN